MKNNFLSLVTKMPQNTGGGNSQTKRATLALPLRYLCAMLLALVLGIGQMWGEDWTSANIVNNSGAGTKKGHITVSSPGVTSTTSSQMYKPSDAVNEDAVSIATSSTVSTLEATPYIEIKADRGYRISAASFYGGAVNNNDQKIWIFCWNSIPITLQTSSNQEYTLKNQKVTSKPADQNITLTSSTRVVRIYSKIKHSSGLIGSGSGVGGGKGAIVSVSVTEALAPEIEGENQMFNDETIALTGYPAGGAWAVVSGPGEVASDGKLTANGNGTIRVSYTVDAVSTTKNITAAATKNLVWTFDTNGTLPTTAGVTVASPEGKNGGFNSDGTFKLSSNGHYAYIDLTSKNYIVTAAVLNAKTGSASKPIDFGSAASDVADGTTSNSTSTNFEDFEITPVKSSMIFSVIKNSGTSATLKTITLTVKKAVSHTLSYAISPDHDPAYATVTLGATSLIEGATTTATYSAIDAAYEFDEWQISGTDATLSSTSTNPTTITMGSADATVTLKLKAAVTKYTITYSKGAYGTGDAIPDGKKDEGVDFTLSDATYSRDGYVQTGWATEDGGAKAYELGGTYSTDADEDLFPFWTPVYTVTKGTHANGDFTISPASLVAGGTVTLDPTPADGYMFSAWEILKTSDASATGITVTNKQFEMPAYGVTINATFVADTRKKVLYLTTTNEANTKANDKLYAALKDDYNVTIAAPASQTLTDYDLIVLHESIGGTSSAAAVTGCKTTSVPVLNTKSYFYGADKDASKRWTWGAPNAGTSVNGATLNSAYCNIASHPLFNDVTVSEGFFAITTDAAEKCMQPVGSFATGYEGYTLATTPNAATPGGTGCAIHEIPAGTTARGATSGKYLMISVSNAKLNALNANGQKLFQNAAAYLVGSTAWTPISVPTSPGVTATPSENYTEGNTITLTASATGTTASTTYTWYKGDDWATASATTPVQAAATAASDGNVFTKTAVLGDAGTYWCNISNGTSCDVQASVTITVSSASTPTHAISYDNTKDADMSAYPTEYTEGVGIASFAALADITGWHFVEWSPASIAPDATTDQTITAVWAQVFEVTFDLRGHGASIDAQNIVDGGKVTKPDDPVAIGYDFGGWFTDEECTAGNEFDFNTSITAATPLYAKWTAFDGCTLLVPATSGEALTVGATVDLQTGSTGGSIMVAGLNDEGTIAYNTKGLSFSNGGKDSVRVTLNNELKNGSVIKLRIMANGATHSKGRGLNLYNAANAKKALLGWQADETVASGDVDEFTYTVEEGDGFAGTNIFILQRQNSVFLQSIKVTNCGDAIVYHNVTSAVDPADKGTVTLGATSVREGYTTTATYSEIDPLYEFVNWTVSGAGASIADASANPAVITMGTADAVVTLNLRLIPVKFTVEYYDGATLMGSEQVAVNENPTASEIVTAKRHYTFLGWSDTDGGDVVALNTITRTEAGTVKLYAKYEAVACPTSGTIFSMESDEAKKPASTVTIAKDASIDLAEYATISGGNAMIINGETSGKDAISTDGEFLLKATKEVMKIELNCVLQKGDIIRIPDNSAKLVISTSNAKTGTYQAFADKNTHEFAVTAAWAGVDDIYVLYDGTSLKFTKVYVIRPAKYDVSFNMMGHGSAIADLEDVVEGSKIVAPSPAPTDVDYSFAGWYKENTLENEWKFDVDVVETNTTLYAKWLDKSDATLKSLKYGETDIVLVVDQDTYDITLPSLTSSVPALTAETNNPNATKLIANGTFDGAGNATSTVTVTPEVGADKVYTVNFSRGVALEQATVTASTEWDWSAAGVSAEIKESNTPGLSGNDVVIANVPGVKNDADFNSQALKASGTNAIRTTYFQGKELNIKTDKEGMLIVDFSGTNNKARVLKVYDNADTEIAAWSYNSDARQVQQVVVPAGKVTLKAFEGESGNNARIYNLKFYAYDTERADSWIAPGELGTICYPNGHIITGAEVYEMAGVDENNKFVFDQVEKTEPGKPYLFVATSYEPIKLYKTTAAAEVSPIANNGMIGTFVSIDLDYTDERAAKWYYFSGKKFYAVSKRTDNLNVPANRAYVDMNESHPAGAPKHGVRRITFDVQGTNIATGIENAAATDKPAKMLINGQLFILRGEKMYDAKGQLVK